MKMDPKFDFYHEFGEKWNQKLRSVRITGFVIGVLMLILAVLLMIFPVKSVFVFSTIAALLIVAFGFFRAVDYFCAQPFLRDPGDLVGGILNILIGVMLLCSPPEATVSTFTFLFGILLMVFGIHKIALAHKLSWVGIQNDGWVIASGVLNILAAVVFIVLPMVSSIMLNYMIAAYVLVGGVSLLIETAAMKDFKI